MSTLSSPPNTVPTSPRSLSTLVTVSMRRFFCITLLSRSCVTSLSITCSSPCPPTTDTDTNHSITTVTSSDQSSQTFTDNSAAMWRTQRNLSLCPISYRRRILNDLDPQKYRIIKITPSFLGHDQHHRNNIETFCYYLFTLLIPEVLRSGLILTGQNR